MKDYSKYFVLAGRLVIGGLFLYASINKIFDPAGFASSIRNYMILPPEWSNVAALILPWIEVIAGAFLIVGVQIKPSALLTTGMLALFFVAIVYAFSVGLDIDCGCFSTKPDSPGRVGIYHIIRDGTLFLVSFFVLAADKGDFGLSGLVK